MSDGEHIAKLIALASDDETLQEAQHAAAKKELRAVGLTYPHDACAITQSALLQAAGIEVPDTYGALALGVLMEKRGWRRIAVGKQAPGDLGSTCKNEPDHGSDHIYLVLRTLNEDEMVVADNQSRVPHFRYASGKGGKTPTTHFLRAPADGAGQAQVLTGAPSKPVLAEKITTVSPQRLSPEQALQRIFAVLKEMVEGQS